MECIDEDGDDYSAAIDCDDFDPTVYDTGCDNEPQPASEPTMEPTNEPTNEPTSETTGGDPGGHVDDCTDQDGNTISLDDPNPQ